ncbi:MAG: extracellular solute-binding protein [Anaerolinea sp.]|nr:extracellular solute-binding protein [Anaerolinea sp.]
MRKLVLLVLAALLALSGAVMAQDDLANVDPSGQTVIYWHQFRDAQGATIDALIAQFNETNEYGITVEGTFQGSYNEMRDLVNAGIVSGELPNLAAGYANDAASYARDGAVVDLLPYFNSPEWGLSADEMADFNMGILAANTAADGQLLAWPHQSSAQVLVYNETMLSELGFDAAPTTFEDFRTIACAAAEMTTADGGDVQGFPIVADASAFESFVANMGGSIYDAEANAFTFAGNQAVTDVLSFYKDLYESGCAYIPAERFAEQTDFALGLNPFFLSSTAGFTFINAALVDNNAAFTWNVSTLPYTEGSQALQVFIPSIIMFQSTPEAQLASWLFLKSLISPEAAATWSAGTGYFNPVPSSAAMLTEEGFGANAAIFPYFSTANDILNNPDVNIYGSPAISAYGTVRGALSEAVANVTTNGMSVEDAVATLQAAADQAIADAQ